MCLLMCRFRHWRVCQESVSEWWNVRGSSRRVHVSMYRWIHRTCLQQWLVDVTETSELLAMILLAYSRRHHCFDIFYLMFYILESIYILQINGFDIVLSRYKTWSGVYVKCKCSYLWFVFRLFSFFFTNESDNRRESCYCKHHVSVCVCVHMFLCVSMCVQVCAQASNYRY